MLLPQPKGEEEGGGGEGILCCLLSNWPSGPHALAPTYFSFLPISVCCTTSTLHSSQMSLFKLFLTQMLGLFLYSDSSLHLKIIYREIPD